jgi:hypothetical protein
VQYDRELGRICRQRKLPRVAASAAVGGTGCVIAPGRRATGKDRGTQRNEEQEPIGPGGSPRRPPAARLPTPQ